MECSRRQKEGAKDERRGTSWLCTQQRSTHVVQAYLLPRFSPDFQFGHKLTCEPWSIEIEVSTFGQWGMSSLICEVFVWEYFMHVFSNKDSAAKVTHVFSNNLTNLNLFPTASVMGYLWGKKSMSTTRIVLNLIFPLHFWWMFDEGLIPEGAKMFWDCNKTVSVVHELRKFAGNC